MTEKLAENRNLRRVRFGRSGFIIIISIISLSTKDPDVPPEEVPPEEVPPDFTSFCSAALILSFFEMGSVGVEIGDRDTFLFDAVGSISESSEEELV